MEQTRLVDFGRIDQTTDPTYFIRFLDAACAEASFQAYKQRMIQLLDVQEGRRYLDVGCGTGDDVRALAGLVGSQGLIAGIDNSQAMIAEANRRAEGSPLRVQFQAGDALNLPFDAGSFDGSLADRSLMHIPDPLRAIAEMARVTRPGGSVVVFEVDFETLVIDAADRVLARKVAHSWCDSFRNGWLGRHIPALFQDVGLTEVRVQPHTLILTPALATLLLGPPTADKAVAKGILTPAEGRAWREHFEDLQRTGRFFSTLSGYIVAGHKPSGVKP